MSVSAFSRFKILKIFQNVPFDSRYIVESVHKSVLWYSGFGYEFVNSKMNAEGSTSFEALNPHKIFILEKRIKKKVKIRRQPIKNFVKRIIKSDLKDLKCFF